MAGMLTVACASPAANTANSTKVTNTTNTASVANTANTAPASANNAVANTQGGSQTFTHEAGGITFEVPAGWKSEPDGEQLTVSSPDDSIGIVFWVPAEGDFEAATKALGEELGKQVKNLKIDGEPKQDTHNGMPHAAITGSGQVEGQDILFSADLLQAKKPIIVLTFGSAENLKKHEADYMKLVNSIKKIG
jgi:predicted Zn-dependent protease